MGEIAPHNDEMLIDVGDEDGTPEPPTVTAAKIQLPQPDHQPEYTQETHADVHLRNFGSNTKGGPEVVSKTPEPSPPVAQALVSARAGPVVRVQHVTVIPTNSSGTTQAPWGSITPTANRSNSTGFEATPLQEYQVDKNSVPAPTEACNPEYPTLVATDEIKDNDDSSTSSDEDAQNVAGKIYKALAFGKTKEKTPTTLTPEGQIKQLRKKLKKARSERNGLRVNIDGEREKLVEARRAWEYKESLLETGNQKLTRENTRLASEFQRLQEENRRLCDNIRTLERDLGTFKDTQQHARGELESLKSEMRRQELAYNAKITQLEHENARHEKNIVGAQSAAKEMMEQNKSFAVSDSDVRTWFTGHEGAWYDWVKDFVYRRADVVANLPAAAVKEFAGFVILENGQLPRELLAETRAPYILLHGLLANFVCKEAFASPWWVFDAIDEFGPKAPPLPKRSAAGAPEDAEMTGTEGNGGASDGVRGRDDFESMKDHMETLYSLLQVIQEKDSHQWRANLMRIFAVNGIGGLYDHVQAGKHAKRLAEERAGHARRLAHRFLSGAAQYLLKQLTPQEAEVCRGRLEEQIDLALQKSVKLWCHRSAIRIYDLPAMQRGRQGAFYENYQVMQSHQSQKLNPPEDFYGLPIVVVVQPGIAASGTEEGQNYAAVSRVWMKARVWVGGTGGRKRDLEAAKEVAREAGLGRQGERYATSGRFPRLAGNQG